MKYPQIRKHSVTSLLVLLALLMTSCGGNGDKGPEASRIQRIEITPGSVTFGAVGQTKTLTAQAFGVDDVELDAELSWTSSDPSVVSVDTSGVLTAEGALGSATITAQAEGVGGSLLASVIVAQPNTEFVTDDQVVGDFKLVDPNADLEPGLLYEVTLSGTDAPDVGNILLGSEEQPVGGEVVSTRTENGNTVVTLELLPLDELFAEVKVNEVLDLNNVALELPDDVAEAYTMTRQNDGSYLFTLKSGARFDGIGVQKATSGPEIEKSFGPVKCRTELTTVPITFNVLPTTFALTFDLDFILDYDSAMGGLQKLSVNGETKAEFKVTPTLTAQFEGKIECSIELIVIPVPVGGPLALFFGGTVPLGAGFEASGKITLAQFGLEVSSEVSASAEIGMQCPGGGECTMINELMSDAKADYKAIFPDGANLDSQFRIEPKLNAHGFMKIALGSKLFAALRFDTFEIKAGITQGANLSTVSAQMGDPDYASKYQLSLDVVAGLASDAEDLFKFLTINVAQLELKYSLLLYESPKAVSAKADVASFETGDEVNFDVKLDPNTLDYLVLTQVTPYNVDEIVVYRDVGTGGVIEPEEVARTTATAGQTDFDLSWTATSNGSIEDRFFVFVDTKALAIPFTNGLIGVPFVDELEIASVAAGTDSGDLKITPNDATVFVGESQQFTAELMNIPTTDVSWSATAGTINAGGLYTAGMQAGDYVVTATSTVNTGLVAQAIVHVVPDSNHMLILEDIYARAFAGGAFGGYSEIALDVAEIPFFLSAAFNALGPVSGGLDVTTGPGGVVTMTASGTFPGPTSQLTIQLAFVTSGGTYDYTWEADVPPFTSPARAEALLRTGPRISTNNGRIQHTCSGPTCPNGDSSVASGTGRISPGVYTFRLDSYNGPNNLGMGGPYNVTLTLTPDML